MASARTIVRLGIACCIVAAACSPSGTGDDAGSATEPPDSPPISIPGEPWDESCDEIVTDHLALVGHLVDTYGELPPSQSLFAMRADPTYIEQSGQLQSQVGLRGCSRLIGKIATAVRLDTVPHDTPFEQYVKLWPIDAFAAPGFFGGPDFSVYAQFPDVEPPQEPVAPTVDTPFDSCNDAYSLEVALFDYHFASEAYAAFNPGAATPTTDVDALFEVIADAFVTLGCEREDEARALLEEASRRSATDLTQAAVKERLGIAAQQHLSVPFAPPLYPDAVAHERAESAASLLAGGQPDDLLSTISAETAEPPAGYDQLIDLPGGGVGGFVSVVPAGWATNPLEDDGDQLALGEFDVNVGRYAAGTEASIWQREAEVVFVAHTPSPDPYGLILVEVVPGGLTDDLMESSLRDPTRVETAAGSVFRYDATPPPRPMFDGIDAVNYELVLPELNATYRVRCLFPEATPTDTLTHCDEFITHFLPVGRIATGAAPSP